MIVEVRKWVAGGLEQGEEGEGVGGEEEEVEVETGVDKGGNMGAGVGNGDGQEGGAGEGRDQEVPLGEHVLPGVARGGCRQGEKQSGGVGGKNGQA